MDADLQSLRALRSLCGGAARFRLIKALYAQPERQWALRALAANAGVDPAQALRLIGDFTEQGLCEAVAGTPHRRYQAASGYPLALALREICQMPDAPAEEDDEVDLGRAPVLRTLLWTGSAPERIPAREAFRLYETNWRFIKGVTMPPEERRLLDRLKRDYGGGAILG